MKTFDLEGDQIQRVGGDTVGSVHVPTQPITQPVNDGRIVQLQSQVPIPSNDVPAVVSGDAPQAPTISQSLIGTPFGYQFSYYQVAATFGAIDGYNIYRNTTGALDGSQTKIQYLKHSPQALGAIVVTDTLVPATGKFYFYWVSAVKSDGSESALVAAQSGTVPGSIGVIPPSNSPNQLNGFTWAVTVNSVTFSWQVSPIFRADGTVSNTIPAGTQAVTGLNASTSYRGYPYYDEAGQTLKFVSTELVFPTITSVSLNGSTGFVQTASSITTPSVFTVEFWVNIGTSAATMGLIQLAAPQGSGVGTAASIALYTSAGNVVAAIQNTTPAWTTATSTAINDGNWHHVVFTYSAGTGNLYIDNGTPVTNAAMGTIIGTGSLFWHLGMILGVTGAPVTTNQFLNGKISNCAVYGSALTAAQVSNHFITGINIGTGTSTYSAVLMPDTPSYFWKLNEAAGTSAADSAGSNTGTYSGGFTLNQQAAVVVAAGTPPILWPFQNYLCSQAQFLRNRIPMSATSVNPITTAAGSGSGGGGGGGGGGRGGCFSANTKVQVKIQPVWDLILNVPFRHLKPGLLVLTAKGTWRPIKRVLIHDWNSPMFDMGGGELVTSWHRLKGETSWERAADTLSDSMHYQGKVYDLEVDTDEPEDEVLTLNTERSYTLTNGRVAHNVALFDK